MTIVFWQRENIMLRFNLTYLQKPKNFKGVEKKNKTIAFCYLAEKPKSHLLSMFPPNFSGLTSNLQLDLNDGLKPLFNKNSLTQQEAHLETSVSTTSSHEPMK